MSASPVSQPAAPRRPSLEEATTSELVDRLMGIYQSIRAAPLPPTDMDPNSPEAAAFFERKAGELRELSEVLEAEIQAFSGSPEHQELRSRRDNAYREKSKLKNLLIRLRRANGQDICLRPLRGQKARIGFDYHLHPPRTQKARRRSKKGGKRLAQLRSKERKRWTLQKPEATERCESLVNRLNFQIIRAQYVALMQTEEVMRRLAWARGSRKVESLFERVRNCMADVDTKRRELEWDLSMTQREIEFMKHEREQLYKSLFPKNETTEGTEEV